MSAIEVEEAANKLYMELVATREALIRVYLAEASLNVQDIELVERRNKDNSVSWYIQKKEVAIYNGQDL